MGRRSGVSAPGIGWVGPALKISNAARVSSFPFFFLFFCFCFVLFVFESIYVCWENRKRWSSDCCEMFGLGVRAPILIDLAPELFYCKLIWSF